MNKLLTFELEKDLDSINILFNECGSGIIVQQFRKAQETRLIQNLNICSSVNSGLSSIGQCQDCLFIKHVKIIPMSNHGHSDDLLLTFEFNKENNIIEIYVNDIGASKMIEFISGTLELKDHLHMMTKDWGGKELSNIRFNESNELVNLVTIVYLENKDIIHKR